MAYKKFDDPNTKVDQSKMKTYASPMEYMRRALQGVANRVLGGTEGTSSSPVTAGCADGSTGGIQIVNQIAVVIDGAQGTCIGQDNLKMTAGTMASNSVAKFLVATGTGTSGTVIGPGNVVSKADYTTAALAAAAAKLPDLPDGYCAIGYATFNTPTASAVVLSSCGLLSTAGTVTYADLICMPYSL